MPGGVEVRCEGVVHLYRTFAGHDVVALRGIDLTIAAGERVAFLGPSGCGKSTLLTLLGGIQRPSAGQRPPRRRGDLPARRATADPGALPAGLHDAAGRDPQPAPLRHRPPEPLVRPARRRRRRARADLPPARASCWTASASPTSATRSVSTHVGRPAPAPRPRLCRRHRTPAAARRRAHQPAQPRRPRRRRRPDPPPRRRLRHHGRGGDPPGRGRRHVPPHHDDEGRADRGGGTLRLGVRHPRRGGAAAPADPAGLACGRAGTLVRIESDERRPARGHPAGRRRPRCADGRDGRRDRRARRSPGSATSPTGRCSATSSVAFAPGPDDRALRSERVGQDHAAVAWPAACSQPSPGAATFDGRPTWRGTGDPDPDVAFVLQVYGLVPILSARENVSVALRARGIAAAGRRRGAPRRRWPTCASATSAPARSRSSPAGSSSGSRSPARSSCAPRCCWPTSRPASSTPAPATWCCGLLRAEADRGAVVVVATHDPEVVEPVRRAPPDGRGPAAGERRCARPPDRRAPDECPLMVPAPGPATGVWARGRAPRSVTATAVTGALVVTGRRRRTRRSRPARRCSPRWCCRCPSPRSSAVAPAATVARVRGVARPATGGLVRGPAWRRCSAAPCWAAAVGAVVRRRLREPGRGRLLGGGEPARGRRPGRRARWSWGPRSCSPASPPGSRPRAAGRAGARRSAPAQGRASARRSAWSVASRSGDRGRRGRLPRRTGGDAGASSRWAPCWSAPPPASWSCGHLAAAPLVLGGASARSTGTVLGAAARPRGRAGTAGAGRGGRGGGGGRRDRGRDGDRQLVRGDRPAPAGRAGVLRPAERHRAGGAAPHPEPRPRRSVADGRGRLDPAGRRRSRGSPTSTSSATRGWWATCWPTTPGDLTRDLPALRDAAPVDARRRVTG